MSRHRLHVATSYTAAHVATSYSCRDIPTLLPMSRPQNDVATSNQFSPISTTSRRHFFHVATSLADTLVATSNMMSRPQAQLATSCCNSTRSRRPFSGRDLTSHHTRSRLHNHVATSRGPNSLKFFFFFIIQQPSFLLLH